MPQGTVDLFLRNDFGLVRYAGTAVPNEHTVPLPPRQEDAPQL